MLGTLKCSTEGGATDYSATEYILQYAGAASIIFSQSNRDTLAGKENRVIKKRVDDGSRFEGFGGGER